MNTSDRLFVSAQTFLVLTFVAKTDIGTTVGFVIWLLLTVASAVVGHWESNP